MGQRTIEKELRYIADILILNGTLTDCPGLIHGKTGIAIFFYHYARLTKNGLYEEYAKDLIAEIISQLHVNSPADYKTGIAGIGVGLDYLIRHRFLNADEDVFEDFDQRMFRAVMYEPCTDYSLYDGLAGYRRYWLMRLHRQPSLEQAQKCLRHITQYIDEKDVIIKRMPEFDIDKLLDNMGMLSGYAGAGLIRIQTIDPEIVTWRNLL